MNNLGNIWKGVDYVLLQKKAKVLCNARCQNRGQPIGVVIENKNKIK